MIDQTHPASAPVVRMVVSDVDGTLVGASRAVSPAVKSAIAAAQQRGVSFVLCTGRPLFSTRHYIEELGLPGYHILDSGATIASVDDVLYRSHIEPGLVKLFTDDARRAGLHIELYTDDAFYVEPEASHDRNAELHGRTVDRWPPKIARFDEVIGNLPIVKIQVVTSEDDERDQERAMEVRYADQLTSHWSHSPGVPADFINVLPNGSSKGAAVLRLAAHLSIPIEQVLGIGDGLNDEPLLHSVGVPVAMGNAHDALKRLAVWVTTSVDEDGLAVAIDRYILSSQSTSSAGAL